MHRDLAARNILVAGDKTCKVCDSVTLNVKAVCNWHVCYLLI